MIESILIALAALVLVGWYCRRWGIADGYADGYDKGRTKGLLEGAVVGGGLTGGGGGGPKEPA